MKNVFNDSTYQKDIYKYFLKIYNKNGLTLSESQFNRLLNVANKSATKYFKKFKNHLLTHDIYKKIWEREIVSHDLTLKSLKLTHPPSHFAKTANFFNSLPLELIPSLFKKVYDAKPHDRERVWNSFKLPINDLNKEFVEMIEEKNRNMISRGYNSAIDYQLQLNQVSNTQYKNFIKNVDTAVKKMNKMLPKSDLPNWFYSKYNNFPCFVCRMKSFPFERHDSVYNQMSDHYPDLNEFKNKIKIKNNKVDYSSVRYVKKKDVIEILINSKQNMRHQCMDLVHELSHSVYYIKLFKKGIVPSEKGSYINEVQAGKIETEFLQSVSNKLYRASLAQKLSNLVRVLFEIEIYSNPNRSPNKLFAITFNRCFLAANQKDNPLYLIEERVVNSAFKTLPHAIADVNNVESAG